MTYAELVTKIRDYTEVDANVFTATIVNGFILDAEFRVLRDVDSDSNREEGFESTLLNKLKGIYEDLGWNFPSLNDKVNKFFKFI